MAKIVGIGIGDTALVELSQQELAQLIGSQYFHNAPETIRRRIDGNSLPRIGATFSISKWWDRVTEILSKEEELRKLGKTLHGLAELIEGAWPVIVAPIMAKEKADGSS